jgi:hypothetical protein
LMIVMVNARIRWPWRDRGRTAWVADSVLHALRLSSGRLSAVKREWT